MSEKVNKQNPTTLIDKLMTHQTIVSLIVTLLIMVIIYMLAKLSYIFTPLGQVFDIFGLPLITAAVLYYLLAPMVRKLTKIGVEKNIAIWLIFVGITIILIWGTLALLPILRRQGKSLVDSIPYYTNQLNLLLASVPSEVREDPISQNISNFFNGLDVSQISNRFDSLIGSTFGSLGTVIGSITQIVTGILTMPIVLYYLLLEGNKIPRTILYYTPTKHRETVSRILYRSNYQISQYIRGQITVAIIVAILFAIGYGIIGIDYGISLAIFAGFCNVIPYLGSFIAIIPVVIIGVLTSPLMLIKVFIVMFIEQFIEGRFVSPQILGSSLQIHPVTILFVLLGAGKLFGLVGVILGVPGYAVIKVFVGELYRVYREHSEAYDDQGPNDLNYIDLAAISKTESVVSKKAVEVNPGRDIEETSRD